MLELKMRVTSKAFNIVFNFILFTSNGSDEDLVEPATDHFDI